MLEAFLDVLFMLSSFILVGFALTTGKMIAELLFEKRFTARIEIDRQTLGALMDEEEP